MNPEFSAVVRRHWKDTTGYLVAGAQPCIQVAHDEIRHVQRRFVFVDATSIYGLEPEGSWFMGIIVCKGDELDALAEWARDHEAERVHFYLHKDADPAQLTPWRDAGLPLGKVEQDLSSWRDLHKVLGWDLNIQVWEDHGSR